MKKLILSSSLVFALMFANSVYSQKGSPAGVEPHKKDQQKLSPDERVKKQTEQAVAKLGLTADQKTSWESASRERITSNAPLKEKMEGSTTPEERKIIRTQMDANNKKFDENVSGFLTDEQKAKYENFKKEKKKKKHGQGKKGIY